MKRVVLSVILSTLPVLAPAAAFGEDSSRCTTEAMHLAGYFRAFMEALDALRGQDAARTTVMGHLGPVLCSGRLVAIRECKAKTLGDVFPGDQPKAKLIDGLCDLTAPSAAPDPKLWESGPPK